MSLEDKILAVKQFPKNKWAERICAELGYGAAISYVKNHCYNDVLEAAADFINRKYGEGTVELMIQDSYFNMRQMIEPCMYIIDRAKSAMRGVGMEPVEVPIRGGTDGARLSYMGLPCPNLCTGGENYHGRFEYIPVEDMDLCTRMLVEILTTL